MSKLTLSQLTEILTDAANNLLEAQPEMLLKEPGRNEKLQIAFCDMFVDFSKQLIDCPTFDNLLNFANAAGLEQSIHDMFDAKHINITEDRAALHTLLRMPKVFPKSIYPAPSGKVVDYHDLIIQNLNKMETLVNQIHNGLFYGYSGQKITDVVNLGVGGSDLGPVMATFALSNFSCEVINPVNVHFASSIDGSQLSNILPNLNPETTLFIFSSKSFKTIDTHANAETALSWLAYHSQLSKQEIIAKHFIGVSTRSDLMSEWGIPENNQLQLWDWVGGRFSVWSAIGLPIALKIGMRGFKKFLEGAHAIDVHFKTAPFEQNIPVIMGLMGVWNASFLKMVGHAILPYDGLLKYLPNYLTQLEMESNGKSIDKNMEPVKHPTCPILWGDVGSNAQHAFYQLLHQGTFKVSSDFITPINKRDGHKALASLSHQQNLNLANCLAQSRVLFLGEAAICTDKARPVYMHHRGGQPSTTILIDHLTPETLGKLLALYEHKVYVMSVLWNINPFDQWGVELGKTIALDIETRLNPNAAASKQNADDCLKFDSSTETLLGHIKKRQVLRS